MRELDYCLVKQRDNGIIAFVIHSSLLFFYFSFSFKEYGGGMGYLFCFLMKAPLFRKACQAEAELCSDVLCLIRIIATLQFDWV